jgi:hypothetical protein
MRLGKKGAGLEIASEVSNGIEEWDNKYRALFKAGALSRLEPGPKLAFQIEQEWGTVRIWEDSALESPTPRVKFLVGQPRHGDTPVRSKNSSRSLP